MEKKSKIIIMALCGACVLILFTSVSFVMGTRSLDAEKQTPQPMESAAGSEFAAIEQIGYAPAGTPIYQQPDIAGEIIATVGPDDAILLIGQSAGWYRCIVQHIMGYVPEGSITPSTEEVAPGVEEAIAGGVYLGEGDLDGGQGDVPDAPVAPTPPTRATTTAAPPSSMATAPTQQEVVNQQAIAGNMLAGINEGRAENGLPALSMDSNLRSAALSEATTDAKNGAGSRLSSEGGAKRIGKLSDYAQMTGITKIGIAVVSGKGGYYYVIKAS